MRCFELFHGKYFRLLCPVNFLDAMACKWRFSCEREPERFAQRVDIGAHVERRMFKLLRAGECRRTDESVMGQGLRIGLSVNCLGQCRGDLLCDLDSRARIEQPGAANAFIEGLALD